VRAEVLAVLHAQHCCNAVAALFGTWGGEPLIFLL
jgi:hypothetical protein